MSSLGGDIWDGMTSAADYGVKSAKLQAEMKFRSLYGELMDCRQVLTAAQGALEVEQLAYQASELKFNQGAISKNVLLTAADELQTAKEAVLTAENNLFSTYNEYTWAVKHGIFM
jgi:outer membrane protein TolC